MHHLQNDEFNEPNSSIAHTDGQIDPSEERPLLAHQESSTSIIIEGDNLSNTTGNLMGNYFRGLNEERLGALQNPRSPIAPLQTNWSYENDQNDSVASNSHLQSNNRSWRMNLNDVLSFSSSPSTEAIRWIAQSTNLYTQLNTQDNITEPEHRGRQQSSGPSILSEMQPGRRQSIRIPRTIAQRTTTNSDILSASINQTVSNNAGTPTQPTLAELSSIGQNNIDLPRLPENIPNAAPQTPPIHDDNNVISNMFVKVISHFARYLPFICILSIKFIHDHMLGLLDLLLLHGLLYHTNKSLCEQIAKFSQKNYGILVRDFGLVFSTIAFQFLITASTPDPFGLLIGPPSDNVAVEISMVYKNGKIIAEKSSAAQMFINYLSNVKSKVSSTSSSAETVTITNAISLGLLLYYVAVNDLVLKLITIQTKIFVTMLPTNVIRHKPRARLYVFIEYLSQFYRSFAPIHQWLVFLFESYSNLEVISGILFSCFYMGAKGFEFVERGKTLRRALISLVLNTDSDHKPTRDELDAAGPTCPICHEEFCSPIVLKCTHIFCDECVSTWFKREQTCPMCRAKISDDPTWQDGSTSFFYQLC